jgi:hypothetical protein
MHDQQNIKTVRVLVNRHDLGTKTKRTRRMTANSWFNVFPVSGGKKYSNARIWSLAQKKITAKYPWRHEGASDRRVK